jgi:hypothetical protein
VLRLDAHFAAAGARAGAALVEHVEDVFHGQAPEISDPGSEITGLIPDTSLLT